MSPVHFLTRVNSVLLSVQYVDSQVLLAHLLYVVQQKFVAFFLHTGMCVTACDFMHMRKNAYRCTPSRVIVVCTFIHTYVNAKEADAHD